MYIKGFSPPRLLLRQESHALFGGRAVLLFRVVPSAVRAGVLYFVASFMTCRTLLCIPKIATFADLANEVGNLERERANTSFGDPEEQRAVRTNERIVVEGFIRVGVVSCCYYFFLVCINLWPVDGFCAKVPPDWLLFYVSSALYFPCGVSETSR